MDDEDANGAILIAAYVDVSGRGVSVYMWSHRGTQRLEKHEYRQKVHDNPKWLTLLLCSPNSEGSIVTESILISFENCSDISAG